MAERLEPIGYQSTAIGAPCEAHVVRYPVGGYSNGLHSPNAPSLRASYRHC